MNNERNPMTNIAPIPPSILGGDPFNQFRFLYRRELLWKLFDEDYCYSVMKACFEAGGTAYDLSFDVNTRLFRRLLDETGEKLLGFGNPTWEQGVFLNGKYIQYSRDRILKTLVERVFPRPLAKQVEEKLSVDDMLVFGYDRKAKSLTDEEIASIELNKWSFIQRLSIFKDCQYIFLGGSDADWLVSLGRVDIIVEMARITRSLGFVPMVLCQYASHIVPLIESSGADVDGYAVPLNRDWSWMNRDDCVDVVKSLKKPVVAFMPFASGGLRNDLRGALDWLYTEIGVESILFGTATPEHARHTTEIARAARTAVTEALSIERRP
jgi:hypothetical protein